MLKQRAPSMARRLSNVRRVCIVGGGPSGVAAAKFLRAEDHFSKIDVFEQRSATAGVWHHEPDNDAPPRYPVPHADPDVPVEKPVWRGTSEKRATFQSPMYSTLEANLPKMMMQHSDYAFPDDIQLFPTRRQITAYLHRYADDVRSMITFETQVTNIDLEQEDPAVWNVTTEDLRSSHSTTRQYDAVLVASGHYQIPFIPSYPGIAEYNAARPDDILHSKYFDDPANYKDKVRRSIQPQIIEQISNVNPKTVLTVGHGPSGSDMAGQIASYTSNLHISTRSKPALPLPQGSTHHPGISSFTHSTRTATFTDGSTLANIDRILFCTGYLYSYPFLSPALRRTLDPRADGIRAHGTYAHLLLRVNPTLALTCVPWNIIPFPVAEAQGAVLARLWSGRLLVPDEAEMRRWEDERVQRAGDGKAFHKLAPPQDSAYLNWLGEWSQRAEGEREGRGRKAPVWDRRMCWMRGECGKMRTAFFGLGEQRKSVRTLEEIGFVYGEGAS